MAVGILAGIVLTFATLRLRDDYLAIVTLAFGEVIRLVALNERWLANGADGLSGILAPLKSTLGLAGFSLFYLILVTALVALLWWGLRRLGRSPYGRALRAVREDPELARFAGKNVLRFKFESFALSAAIAGLRRPLRTLSILHIARPLRAAHHDLHLPRRHIGWRRPSAGRRAGGLCRDGFPGSRPLRRAGLPGLEPVQLAAVQGMLTGAALLLVLRLRPQGMLPERLLAAPLNR